MHLPPLKCYPALNQARICRISPKLSSILSSFLTIVYIIRKKFPPQVKAKANCWLRTFSADTPSEFVTRTALTNILKNNLYGFAKGLVTQLIRQKQKTTKTRGLTRKLPNVNL